MKKLLILLVLLLPAATVLAEGDSTEVKAKAEPAETKSAADSTEKAKGPEMITTESGLKYMDLVAGTGKEAVNGMKVQCHYTLWIADENDKPGQKIQSSKDANRPFDFTVGGPLIKGWNEGMLGMKEGGTRMLIIPPNLGYGNNPPPGSGIPTDKNLIFEIEFLKAL